MTGSAIPIGAMGFPPAPGRDSARRRLAATVLLLVLAATANAHPLAPALLELRQRGATSTYDVRWKTSTLRVPGSDVQPVIPDHCKTSGGIRTEENAGSLFRTWSIECGKRGIVGAKVGFRGLGAAKIDGLVRVELSDGRLVRGVVTATNSLIDVPEAEGRYDVFLDYLGLGFDHILSGLDHLLFVFGLLLLVPSPAALVKTVTAFTAGHSVTLSLAALGWVRYPTRPIELVIALSVLLLAIEITRDEERPTLMRRWPWAIALGFGLLHGLGFAGALAEVGLPRHEIPLALLSFNIGIELGQLTFVVLVLVARKVLAPLLQWIPRWAGVIPTYAMGTLAAFWCWQRLAAVLAG